MERPDKALVPTPGVDIDGVRRAWIESIDQQTIALASDYPQGYLVKAHRHSRAQLLYALRGVVTVTTGMGRWVVPTGHALWIPARIEHAVEMLGRVSMRSVYVAPDAIEGLPDGFRVVAVTDLMRSLIVEAVTLPLAHEPMSRAGLVMALITLEIPRLPEQPLGLAFPAEPRFAMLCRRFLERPSPHARIDEWADQLAMSRRAFTRAFRRETGLSLQAWRQQACLFAALPRLADGEPVTSVALDLGYESVAAFTTMFKRMLGVPPSHYLRESHDAQVSERRQPGT
ncbi:MAG: AraC family transcriptional regulator [Phreatobacter sp.]